MEVYNKINNLLTEMNQYTLLLKDYKDKNSDNKSINIDSNSNESNDKEDIKKTTTMNSTDIINVVNTNGQNDKNSDINHFINLDELNKL